MLINICNSSFLNIKKLLHMLQLKKIGYWTPIYFVVLVLRNCTRYVHYTNGTKCMCRTFRYVVSRVKKENLDFQCKDGFRQPNMSILHIKVHLCWIAHDDLKSHRLKIWLWFDDDDKRYVSYPNVMLSTCVCCQYCSTCRFTLTSIISFNRMDNINYLAIMITLSLLSKEPSSGGAIKFVGESGMYGIRHLGYWKVEGGGII